MSPSFRIMSVRVILPLPRQPICLSSCRRGLRRRGCTLPSCSAGQPVKVRSLLRRSLRTSASIWAWVKLYSPLSFLLRLNSRLTTDLSFFIVSAITFCAKPCLYITEIVYLCALVSWLILCNFWKGLQRYQFFHQGERDFPSFS